MTLRELRILVMNLPEESATARAYRGTHWGSLEYMLADLRDITHIARMEFIGANSKDGYKGPPFKAWPRPGEDMTIDAEENDDKPKITAREVHDMLLGGGN